MRIGLLGFGTVGQGVYNLTKPREDMEVAWVLCRRELALPDARVTHDFLDILGDASVDTVSYPHLPWPPHKRGLSCCKA